MDNNSVLHLDLYENDQLYLINNFLFLILINRFYRHNEDIFFLPKDIQFKIELQNCFKNLFVEYPILNIFPIKELKISNLPPLIVPKELDSDIQIVANYLKALKENKINEFDLIFPNITPSEFEKNFYYIKKKKYSTSIKATLLPDIECQELIFNEIKEFYREPNYYQITSFIKVLSVQLKKFNQNFYLSAHIIITSNKKSYCKIRTIIVQSLIKLTKYFTKGAFTYFLENDKNMNLSIFENLNEIRDIDSKNINSNILSNDTHQIISFDKIESSLFFFHEGYGQSFSIITNKNPSDREYIDLLYLKNLFAFSERDKIKELPNYNKYTQKDFLIEIKEILDIRNPVYKEEKSYLISLEEICGDYVFTINNFIKFVLILLYISSNIPIIIMGDIGVGINSMIKKIFEIKNNGNSYNLKIFNISPETTNNDIINFVKNIVIPEAERIKNDEEEDRKKYKNMNLYFNETKLAIYFDRINICKSMEIISELIIKNTCQGQNLPSNIVFMASCYPYKKDDIKVNLDENQKNLINSLDDENKKKIKSILDGNSEKVYPLPHSLLNFVIDFGTLTSLDKEYYIRYLLKKFKK